MLGRLQHYGDLSPICTAGRPPSHVPSLATECPDRPPWKSPYKRDPKALKSAGACKPEGEPVVPKSAVPEHLEAGHELGSADREGRSEGQKGKAFRNANYAQAEHYAVEIRSSTLKNLRAPSCILVGDAFLNVPISNDSRSACTAP